MKRLILLLLILSACKTKQPIVVSYTDLRDSTKLEVIATPRVVNKWIRETNKTDRTLILSAKRSSIVGSKNTLKQAVSDNKKQTKIVESNNAVKKVEARKEAEVEKKQIQSVIVAKKQLPNTVKWVAVLVIALIIGYLVIKKKIPFFS